MLPPASQEILNNLTTILERDKVNVAVKSSGQAGLIVGVCTAAGGLLAGQLGIALGGLAGTALNTYLTKDFMPLSKVIKNELTDEQKTKLVRIIRRLIQAGPTGSALSALLSNEKVKTAVIQAVLGFVNNVRR